MIAIVGAGVYGYVMTQKRLANQDNSMSSDIRVWGLTPLSFLGAIVLSFVVFGFFYSYPYQKDISEKNRQVKKLDAKLDSLNKEFYLMKIQLDNMKTVSDGKTESEERKIINTQRQGAVTVIVNRKPCLGEKCNSDSVNHHKASFALK